MIIDEHELIEKFSYGDDVGYDYLIVNAEDKEQIKILKNLKNLYESVSKCDEDKENLNAYEEARNILLQEKVGLNMFLIAEINDLE